MEVEQPTAQGNQTTQNPAATAAPQGAATVVTNPADTRNGNPDELMATETTDNTTRSRDHPPHVSTQNGDTNSLSSLSQASNSGSSNGARNHNTNYQNYDQRPPGTHRPTGPT